MNNKSPDASCRIALAAYLHDLGKFAERAGVFDGDTRLDAHLQLYCPFHADGGWFSHRHAAHTALAFDLIEAQLPDILHGDVYPFAGRTPGEPPVDATDSLLNAAAAHHRPATFLQWIIATADRVASGFEREEFEGYNAAREGTDTGRNHFQARQLTLFEQINRHSFGAADLQHRYPLLALAPATIFPVARQGYEPKDDGTAKAEYRRLWNQFVAALKDEISGIPRSHAQNLPLWLDHFDSLWLTYTSAIPSATAFGVRPDVSLYDHSRTTAALAVALWRWHEESGRTGDPAAQALRERSDFADRKFLLVQGDFFGIQDFIFATGGETRRHAAKLLRGRSFQVSLFTETAALAVLDELGLPPTSQVINAAGKFLIVAPNTEDCRAALQRVREVLEQWFLENTFGQAGIGLAWEPAGCDDFLKGRAGQGDATPFGRTVRRLFASLERAKYQRFDLAQSGARVFAVEFPHGVCEYHGRLPADRPRLGEEAASCAISRDQVAIGEALVQFDRVLVLRSEARDQLHASRDLRVLEVDLFGYSLAFTVESGVRDETGQATGTGRFGTLARLGLLRRCWDFSLPGAQDASGERSLWNGYARRFISGYVPRVQSEDLTPSRRGRYAESDEEPPAGSLETFDRVACEDRTPREDGERWMGIAALAVLKGDIDDLGEIFRGGLGQPTFAKWAALSRQVNAFFAVYLPWLLAREFPRVYTVFAGGDDFFLVGPWYSVQVLAARLREKFAQYVAGNAEVHFSAGIATQKPGAPIQVLAELAHTALLASKDNAGKNALTCFGETIPWSDLARLEAAQDRFETLRRDARFSAGYVYGLLQFLEMRRQELKGEAEAAMWRSRLAYRTRRFVVDKLKLRDEEDRRRRHAEIIQAIVNDGIDGLGSAYRVVLFNHLYKLRDR